MEKILIIDGNNLLFQMFYGMPSKIYNKSGKTIHATIGFISALIRLVKLIEASKIIVAFDYDCSEDRINQYEQYKKNRIDNWDELNDAEVPFNEEENIKKCLDFLNIKYIDSKNMEADDLIASLVLLYKNDNKVFISSYDSDFFQLIDENVSVIRYKGKNSKIIDEDEFYKMFGFSSNKYVFYKCLVGDSADNIKGITSIGKKRATMIVNKYSDYNDLLLDNNPIFSSKIIDNIINEKDTFTINEKLIRLHYIDTINYNINEFSYDENKMKLSNSEILSINGVFD